MSDIDNFSAPTPSLLSKMTARSVGKMGFFQLGLSDKSSGAVGSSGHVQFSFLRKFILWE